LPSQTPHWIRLLERRLLEHWADTEWWTESPVQSLGVWVSWTSQDLNLGKVFLTSPNMVGLSCSLSPAPILLHTWPWICPWLLILWEPNQKNEAATRRTKERRRGESQAQEAMQTGFKSAVIQGSTHKVMIMVYVSIAPKRPMWWSTGPSWRIQSWRGAWVLRAMG
jgi:hypothetical protein